MELAIDQIVVGDRARKDMGDIDSLAESIRENGLLQPIGVWRDGEIYRLAFGGRRLAAVVQEGFDRVHVKLLHTVTEAIEAMRVEDTENTCRKDFTVSEAVALAGRIEAIEKAKAKERQGRRTDLAADVADEELGANLAPSSDAPSKSRDRVAKSVGMGRTSLGKAKDVVDTANDESQTPEVREVAKQAVEEMDRTGKVDRAHQRVQLVKAWADAVERFPFLDGVPADEQPRILSAAQQLLELEAAEYDRRVISFEKHVAAIKRRDPETEAMRRALSRARKDTAALAVAMADVERLVGAVADYPEAVTEHPLISRTWSEMTDACRLALTRLDDITRPQLRRVK